MYQQIFRGKVYSYSYEKETDQFLLFDNNLSVHVLLKDDDAFMFREHLNLIMIEKNDTIKERIERVIEIHFNFATKPCPIPHFVE